MTTELATRAQSAKQPAIFKLMDGDLFFQRANEVYDTLARRAYQLFEGRGRQDGHDLQDWFHAEGELLNVLPMEVSEADDELTVRADLPGFRDKDIEVRVEPRRLIISGKREQLRDEKKRKTVYTERNSNEVFRMFDLPEEVDPDKVTASLHDGTLEIEMPKARPAKMIPVAVKAA
jgi:HSP20 family protein